MTASRVPAFQATKRTDQSENRESARTQEGSRVDIRANYLPSIYQDHQGGGQQGNGQGGREQAVVDFFRGASTGQLKALATNVTQQTNRPLFPRDSVLSLLGPNATPAYFAPESRTEESRRRNWGDWRPYATGGASSGKFTPLSGMPITFDPGDRPISIQVPREVLARSTTVDANMDSQVRHELFEAHLNRGNPMRHRLGVYNLTTASYDA